MGAAPAGYRNVFADGRKEVVIEEQSTSLIQEAYMLMATGTYSLNQIVRIVSDKGLRSRNEKPLQATGLWRILTNPFYCGQIRYKGRLVVGRHQGHVSIETSECSSVTVGKLPNIATATHLFSRRRRGFYSPGPSEQYLRRALSRRAKLHRRR